ncbi:TetR/AcrR family transcriptional regulator [Solitalea canadensis]|uniref:Transcriptional regulator n=1 Tax=Solitalea canadensis (strain ATCC 29591 / DSM 3403 / JCM 21819 / LMG 8368 / NBRC 15130 / NCIMB 12057 / USAM 9D) TaxID=929556 RepID=H8KPN2_SOLCM|nr:TetR/AcrR family transcriptional regulator [Solitalea canadensis]AFD05930.1 transcriptional regulator [Solitalea canadensis DSM 3403]
MENQDKKRDRIIEVAQKRFAHYGLTKTTMNEIADDLSMSKALLYYYFPDKSSLYFAVLAKLFNEHFDEMQEEVQKTDSSSEALTIYLRKRHDFIKKYFILLEFNKSFSSENFAQMKSRFSEIRVKEQAFLTRILTEGANSGELKIKDPKKIEELIFDALIGIRLVVLENYSNTLQPDDNQFNMILEKQQLLTELIIKGLRG